MRLTRVDIHGFKSFADRTALDLPPGLSAVVGPNGCGKSNVIDAIKWALGEQRASALRGKDMVDVIFKGNGARAQRNFAEVSLHFDNEDGRLPTEYTEVVITRRLFRTGESEYLINRQPVRLKDVRDLLMDTGLGTGAYSVMEQGRIDAILSANPIERRRIFEEAAGISRYRARRRECESKLQRTEQNLLRLSDVVEELEKRQRSLKVQAGRARSFLEARDRMRELRSRYYVHQWEQLGHTQAAQQAQLEGLVGADGEARRALEQARAEVHALSDRLAGLRGEVDEAAEAFRRASGEVEAVGERQAALRERLAESAEGATRLEGRIRGLQAALAERRSEVQVMEQRVAEVTAEMQAWSTRVDQAAAARETAQADVEAWEAATRVRREEALSRLAALAEVRNRAGHAASDHAALSASRERLSEQIEALAREVEQQTELQQQLDGGARQLERAHDDVAERAEAHRSRQGTLRADLARIDEDLGRRREELAAAVSRRDALDELIARRDGVSPGALCLLESGLPGVEGLIVEQLRAPRALAEAVEAALGSSTQAVLVSDREHALAALSHLADINGGVERGVKGGRVLLVPRDGLRSRSGVSPKGERLLDRLDVQGHPEVYEALLGHVRLVGDRRELLDCVPDGATVWVTPQGELLDERGLLRGGAAGEDGGLLARRAERDELAARCLELEAALAAVHETRAAAHAELTGVDAALAQEETELRRLQSERDRTRERERQVSERRVALDRDLGLRRNDLDALAARLLTVAEKLAAARADEAQLEQQAQADRQTEASEEERHRELRQVASQCQDELAAARLELSARKERVDALASESRQVTRGLEERGSELQHAASERESLLERGRQFEQEQAHIGQRAAELGEERDRCAGLLNQAKQASGVLSGEIERSSAGVTERETLLERAANALSEHRLASQETSIRREELRRKVLEELEVDLAEEREALEDAEGTDWAAVATEIEELKGRLARMGNVNLAAVDELTEVEERLTFLTGQRDDLMAAKQTLADTIARLNRESRERFVNTFDEVREHFRGIFRKLFRGGKADMVLEEGVDVLEAGIEITAAPPGKDARTITLLSGGERTLTAVGLLFSLFRARPSPVCLLDEVDAALDETNIERFCSVLEDFLGESQFLVVTHARRTMSYADQVFGVTMAEHGVSKVLSLSVEEYERSHGKGAEPAVIARPEVRAAVEGAS